MHGAARRGTVDAIDRSVGRCDRSIDRSMRSIDRSNACLECRRRSGSAMRRLLARFNRVLRPPRARTARASSTAPLDHDTRLHTRPLLVLVLVSRLPSSTCVASTRHSDGWPNTHHPRHQSSSRRHPLLPPRDERRPSPSLVSTADEDDFRTYERWRRATRGRERGGRRETIVVVVSSGGG